MIYLDNAATTKMSASVFAEMEPWLKEDFGNPGSITSVGRKAAFAIEVARETVARFMGCAPEQIIFTSGGSEGNNAAIASADGWVFLSAGEHDSVRNAASRHVETPYTEFPLTPYGTIDFDALDRITNENRIMYMSDSSRTLVCSMFVNNETGAINDVKKISSFVHNDERFNGRGATLVDCVQAAGCLPLDMGDIGCDFATVSSHKIHGPKGVGALYVKDPKKFSPLICGGNAQNYGLRGGTENVAGIVGFAKACQDYMDDYHERHYAISKLNTEFVKEIAMYADGDLVKYNQTYGDSWSYSDKIVSLYFPGVDAESLVLALDAQGIIVSAGSACHAQENTPSRTLIAMGYPEERARSSIRVSFSYMNTVEEVRHAARIILDTARILKG